MSVSSRNHGSTLLPLELKSRPKRKSILCYPFDAVITATAKGMDLALITRDLDITGSRLVDIHWN